MTSVVLTAVKVSMLFFRFATSYVSPEYWHLPLSSQGVTTHKTKIGNCRNVGIMFIRHSPDFCYVFMATPYQSIKTLQDVLAGTECMRINVPLSPF
jgi:hypothetical protein